MQQLRHIALQVRALIESLMAKGDNGVLDFHQPPDRRGIPAVMPDVSHQEKHGRQRGPADSGRRV